MFTKAFIPYGGYYASPFAKWQGSLQNAHPIELAGNTAQRWMQSRGIDAAQTFEHLYLGMTIGQKSWFYGSPWAAKLIGAPAIPSNTISQACATATTTVFNASLAVEVGQYETTYCMLTDKSSNGQHAIWPNPNGPGGEVIAENWNMDNIACDPSTGKGMLVTAENVSAEAGFSKQQADELAWRRYEQYADSLANDRAFQKRYMFPIEVQLTRKKTLLLEADEGVNATSLDAISSLRPVAPGGIHSFATQTHPADGNAGIIVTTKQRAAQLSTDPSIPVQVISYGAVRTKAAHMPAAPVSSVRVALDKAGLTIADIKVVKNHNPFIANDLHLAANLGIDPAGINNYGSSLVFGHPNSATLGRLIVEAIEEAAVLGGGYAVVTGCAAGDNAAAIILKVG